VARSVDGWILTGTALDATLTAELVADVAPLGKVSAVSGKKLIFINERGSYK